MYNEKYQTNLIILTICYCNKSYYILVFSVYMLRAKYIILWFNIMSGQYLKCPLEIGNIDNGWYTYNMI